MKFVASRSFADADIAARKLVEIANDVEAVQDGRIYIERVNAPFLAAGGNGNDFRAGIERAIALGWLWLHESGNLPEVHVVGRRCPDRAVWRAGESSSRHPPSSRRPYRSCIFGPLQGAFCCGALAAGIE